MAHRSALYTVQVHVKRHPEDLRPVGDIDERGTRLQQVLADAAQGLEQPNDDGTTVVRCCSVRNVGDELQLLARHGQIGQAADINLQSVREFRQRAEHEHSVVSACLFRLPRDQNLGWLAVHVNFGRSVKGLLERGLKAAFEREQPDLVLTIDPYVEGAVLRQAVDDGAVARIRLLRHVRPRDRGIAQTAKWIRDGDAGQIVVELRSTGEGRIISRRLSSYLSGDRGQRSEILTFAGMRFEEARIQVELPNGTTRTFNIERLEQGHPMTQDMIDLRVDRDGEPTASSLFRELRAALEDTIGRS